MFIKKTNYVIDNFSVEEKAGVVKFLELTNKNMKSNQNKNHNDAIMTYRCKQILWFRYKQQLFFMF